MSENGLHATFEERVIDFTAQTRAALAQHKDALAAQAAQLKELTSLLQIGYGPQNPSVIRRLEAVEEACLKVAELSEAMNKLEATVAELHQDFVERRKEIERDKKLWFGLGEHAMRTLIGATLTALLTATFFYFGLPHLATP